MKNINLDTIKLSWFMSTGEMLEHKFMDKPTFIKGENKTVGQNGQKNGCGKTVVFLDAVLFAFYGQVSREGFKLSDIPYNKGTKKKCIVELTFDIVENDTTKKVKITRTINPSKLVLEVDGVDVSQSNTKSTQEYLVREILSGISIDVFKNSIAMKLDKSKAFMEMAKPDREKFIGGVFDLTYLKNAEKIARDEYNTLKKELGEANAKVSVLVPRVDTIKEQIKKAEDDHNLKIAERNDRLKQFDKAIDNFDEGQRPEELVLEDMLGEVDTKLAALDKHEEEYSNKRFALVNKKNDLSNEIKSHKRKIDSNIQTNTKAEQEKVCPTCKREMDEDCIHGIQESIKERLEENKTLEEKIVSLKQHFDEVVSNSDDLNPIFEKIRKGKETLKGKRSEVSQKVTQNQKDIREYEAHLSKLQTLKDRRELLKEEIKNMSVSSIIDTLKDDLNNTVEDLKTLRKRVTKIDEEMEVLDHVKHLFSENGIRKTILGKLVTLFNSNANMYLQRLEAPCTVEFDDTFGYTLKSLGGTEIPYGGLSGGERLRVVTALAFTFKDILRIQNQIAMSVSIYDEWFDAAIDERGLEIISEILTERNEKYNDTSYIITHRSELNMENSETVTVVKENGITTIDNNG